MNPLIILNKTQKVLSQGNILAILSTSTFLYMINIDYYMAFFISYTLSAQ